MIRPRPIKHRPLFLVRADRDRWRPPWWQRLLQWLKERVA